MQTVDTRGAVQYLLYQHLIVMRLVPTCLQAQLIVRQFSAADEFTTTVATTITTTNTVVLMVCSEHGARTGVKRSCGYLYSTKVPLILSWLYPWKPTERIFAFGLAVYLSVVPRGLILCMKYCLGCLVLSSNTFNFLIGIP